MPFPNFGDGASSTFVSGCTVINEEMEDGAGGWIQELQISQVCLKIYLLTYLVSD